MYQEETVEVDFPYILLAHMIPGSVKSKEGEEVTIGEKIDNVGNSCSTTEPPLHIQAEQCGEGVPITFQNRFLKRNSLVFLNKESFFKVGKAEEVIKKAGSLPAF